jgi:hypothetical protein
MTTTRVRGGLYIKDTDLQLLAWLAEYRYLQPTHIQRLSSRHIVSIRRRLRQLLAEGHVDRLTLPLARSRPVASPPDEFVYRLGRKGVQHVRDQLGVDVSYTAEKQVGSLSHDLAISVFHLCLALAARQSGRLELEWRQTDLLDHARSERGERLPVNPDGLLALTDTALPAAANTQHFFLEVERSRQHSYEAGDSASLRKVLAYQAYGGQGVHRTTWGIENFRVLTILPTAERAANLRDKIAESQLASDRFWFTDFGRYPLDRPKSVLQNIWSSAGDDDLHALLDNGTAVSERTTVVHLTDRPPRA